MITSVLGSLSALGTRLFPNPRFFGWAVVALSFLACALSSPGQSFVLSLFIEDLITSLDASRLQVSTLYGVATLSAAFFLPLVGGLADRVSGRAFLAMNLLLLGVAVGFFASVQNLWMLGLAFFFLRLLGQGAVGLGTLTETVRWFKRYRGRALALGGLGFAFGELIFPKMIFEMSQAWGWRGSLWAIAVAYVLVAAPLFRVLLRPRRADEAMDGGVPPAPVIGSGQGAVELEDEPSFNVKAALRTPVFWGLLGCVSVLPMVVTALIFHQLALFEDVGWGQAQVPAAFVSFALSGVFFSYAAGLVLEKVPVRLGISVGMAFATAAIAVAATTSGEASVSLLYGALLGGASGVLTSSNALIWPEYYGIEALGAIKGVVNAVRNGSTAVGPPLVAWLIGEAAEFERALVVLGVMSAVVVVLALVMRPPRRSEA